MKKSFVNYLQIINTVEIFSIKFRIYFFYLFIYIYYLKCGAIGIKITEKSIENIIVYLNKNLFIQSVTVLINLVLLTFINEFIIVLKILLLKLLNIYSRA